MASFEKLAPLIAEVLGIEIKNIKLNSSFDSLGADSVNILEILMKVEITFDFEIPDEDDNKFKTVLDLLHYINQHTISMSLE